MALAWRARWKLSVWLVACLALPAAARAAEVDWRAPAECPDAEELRFRVERAIGMPLAHAAPLRFQAHAEASARGYRGRVVIEEGSGTGAAPRARELTAPSCAGLTDMVTVTLALALGAAGLTPAPQDSAIPPAGGARPAADGVAPAPGAAAPTVLPGSSRESPASTLHAGPADDITHEAPPPARSAALFWPALSVWVLGDTGSLPRPGAGLALGVQLESRQAFLRVQGTWLFEQRQQLAVAGEPAPGAELGLAAGALLGCLSPFAAPSRLSAYACAGWELGRLWGQGTGVADARSGVTLWNAPRFDVGASWALGGAGLRLDALLTLAVPLSRDDFVLAELGSVHRPSAGVGRLAIGLGWSPH